MATWVLFESFSCCLSENTSTTFHRTIKTIQFFLKNLTVIASCFLDLSLRILVTEGGLFVLFCSNWVGCRWCLWKIMYFPSTYVWCSWRSNRKGAMMAEDSCTMVPLISYVCRFFSLPCIDAEVPECEMSRYEHFVFFSFRSFNVTTSFWFPYERDMT